MSSRTHSLDEWIAPSLPKSKVNKITQQKKPTLAEYEQWILKNVPLETRSVFGAAAKDTLDDLFSGDTRPKITSYTYSGRDVQKTETIIGQTTK